MRIATAVTGLLGIDLPILAGGTAQDALAVSVSGGLGVIEAGSMDRDELAAAVEQVRAGTDRLFAIRLPLDGAGDRLGSASTRTVQVVVTTGDRLVAGLARPAATWFHTVASLENALAANAADGLIVDDGCMATGPMRFRLLRDIAHTRPGVPLVAVGGTDGADLAAALMLGAGAAWFDDGEGRRANFASRVAGEYEAALRRMPRLVEPTRPRPADRTAREAAALRENLLKRKEQARARSEP